MVLCESLLTEELKSQDGNDKETAAEYAPCLLKLADATGLKNLQNAVLHYVRTPSWVELYASFIFETIGVHDCFFVGA